MTPDSQAELTAQEVSAIAALMSEPTLERAAERVGVNERTLRRWLSERDVFRCELRRTQRAVMAAATIRLQHLVTKAMSTLDSVMDDKEAPHASRVTAARAVLEHASRAVEQAEIIDRLDALERSASGEHSKEGSL